ncbi:ABC transporter substrate-binding protein [Flavisolibacter ginsengisoli]|jgi:peptide/nickel transport system substrate-binding protein|uniref:Peptide/nickel transport system substrate-binding protein n=1 Tax=Flavisolibacter ginsengisoli DSM 18119 TaxID=1121884 RepID=A0A1M4Z267_9BACT|nr:ABC transporter substrate-binding protein [Flavisolibacter ginsengisoli]SHF11832.1 peptide/nickel transport system substrate-binding protein [Flavisolibacter ginsengisoli DSM 18119]
MVSWCKYLLFITVLAVSGCYNSEQKDTGIFHYNESTGIASIDPAFAKNQSIMWPVHQLYNTIVEVDNNLNIVPSLATRWTISEDKTIYTFYLRNDVYFHDDPCFTGGKGRRFTAGDVEYSLKRIVDKTLASPGSWIFNDKVDSSDGFKAVNDTTFQVKLIRPYNPILGILSMQYCSIVAKEAVLKYGTDFRRHAVGTGPFQFVAWEEGQALVLRKNPHYFETDASGKRLPYLNGIKVSFFDSRATEFLLFRQKKLDFINDIDASFKDEVLTKTGTLRKDWRGKIALQTHPYLNIEYFGILVDESNPLLKNSPLKLKKVRQAMNYSIDREKMVLYLRNSLGTPATAGFVPVGLPSFDSTKVKGYHYNPVLARKLLDEAGIKRGEQTVIKLQTIPIYADIGSYIARQMEEIGLKVQVDVVQKSLLLELTSNSRTLFFRGSWIADYPDAENYLSVFYSKNPAPPNYTRYSNKEFDVLFEKAIRETNDSIRYRLYQQADQVMMEDAPVVPLWYDKVVHLVQTNVSGFEPNALNLLELRKVQIAKTSK